MLYPLKIPIQSNQDEKPHDIHLPTYLPTDHLPHSSKHKHLKVPTYLPTYLPTVHTW